MPKMPALDPSVADVLETYPAAVRLKLLALRKLIFETAESTEGVGPVTETLKWGEPAYLTEVSKSGTTVRIAWKAKSPEQYAMYIHCQTKLIDTFRTLFPDEFTYDGNRAIVFEQSEAVSEMPLSHCIAMALTYHRNKAHTRNDRRSISAPGRAATLTSNDSGGAAMDLTYRSPKTVVKQSPIHGKGLFAVASIAAGDIVAVKGGHIVGKQDWDELGKELGPAEIQVTEDLFIAPVRQDHRDGSMLYINHSCDPNIGPQGQIVFAAMRDIAAGEELTHDWATTDDLDYQVACTCCARNCRGTITGKDWMRPELQGKYAGWFSWFLQRKIDGAS